MAALAQKVDTWTPADAAKDRERWKRLRQPEKKPVVTAKLVEVTPATVANIKCDYEISGNVKGRLMGLGEPIPAEKSITVDMVIRQVAAFYCIAPAEIKSDRRSAELIKPRHIAYLLARILTKQSFPAIGKKFNRDHSTLVSGIRKLNPMVPELMERLGENPKLSWAVVVAEKVWREIMLPSEIRLREHYRQCNIIRNNNKKKAALQRGIDA
jgi:hypothetical protein